jgi:hypothetical protein
MRILIRSKQNKEWKLAESVKVKAESELQKMLLESPSLINISEIREGISPLVYALREFGLPGSGYSDIIGFTLEGDIVLIECKLATNQEIKRKVIGQILEYAAYLWRMDYEEFDYRIKRLKGKSLADLVGKRASADWDEENFRNGIINSLAKGSFILIIVVDETNDELRRTIRYLNECSESAFSLHALEMNQFHAGETELLVPRLYGSSTKPPAGETRKQWTEKEFFATFEKRNPKTVDIVKDIYDWTRGEADRVPFGRGKEKGSVSFYYIRDGEIISVFSILTTGRFVLNYGAFYQKIPEQIMEEFHKRITEIPSFKKIPNDFTKWPSIKIEKITKADAEKIKQAIT